MSSGSSANSFLRTLCSLRWVAIAGQAATVLVASGPLNVSLPLAPLWGGVLFLVIFNLYATLLPPRSEELSPGVAFLHLLIDIAVLAWMVGWSGGIHNPFGLLFLVLIALAALALPPRWAFAAALACVAGYAGSAVFGKPLDSPHDQHMLLLWGIAANFIISAGLVFYFLTRLAGGLRARERELAALRERFTRNEGIVALATHAAAMAHDLNTPLATMTLLADEIAVQAQGDEMRSDVATLRQLLALCRERIRNLAVPTQVDLVRVVSQWKLVRPTIELSRTGTLPASLRVEPSIAHLLQALLNNAADAGEEVGDPRVELHLEYQGGTLRGEVRDHGLGIDPDRPLLPATGLFHSGKPQGLGVGLALSHATVEQLGGEMTLTAAEGGGTRIRFDLPLESPA
ncbi:ATP-binding protein [Bordetella genomosp. 13]|uniref:ATP-binding protein n=1 Tax=Bordetella genomosp. 13 TaxID=463040 RepID=UPI0011A498A2|nr:HAMP domain-containing sensor histidine kinase [Bordetella genomosp. 13]